MKIGSNLMRCAPPQSTRYCAFFICSTQFINQKNAYWQKFAQKVVSKVVSNFII